MGFVVKILAPKQLLNSAAGLYMLQISAFLGLEMSKCKCCQNSDSSRDVAEMSFYATPSPSDQNESNFRVNRLPLSTFIIIFTIVGKAMKASNQLTTAIRASKLTAPADSAPKSYDVELDPDYSCVPCDTSNSKALENLAAMVAIEGNFKDVIAEQIHRERRSTEKLVQKKLSAAEQNQAREKWIKEDKERNTRPPRQGLTRMPERDDSYMKKFCHDDLKTNWALQKSLFPAQSPEPWKKPVYGMSKLRKGQLDGSGSVNTKIIKVLFWLKKLADTGEDPNFIKPEQIVEPELEAAKSEPVNPMTLQELMELSSTLHENLSK